MSWIDDRLTEQKALKERKALIAEHAIPIYEALWDKITEYVEEAKARSSPLITNGSLQNRSVISVPPGDGNQKTDQFRLVLEKESIVARGTRELNFEFRLDVCPDRVVCLKLNKEEISVDDAAKEILDKFLFPDLPRLSRRTPA